MDEDGVLEFLCQCMSYVLFTPVRFNSCLFPGYVLSSVVFAFMHYLNDLAPYPMRSPTGGSGTPVACAARSSLKSSACSQPAMLENNIAFPSVFRQLWQGSLQTPPRSDCYQRLLRFEPRHRKCLYAQTELLAASWAGFRL